MRVSGKVNATIATSCAIAVVLVAAATATGDHDSSNASPGSPSSPASSRSAGPAGAQVTVPPAAVDVVASSSPAASSIAVSRRLFSSSPVAVLASSAAASGDAQRLAAEVATALKVPVLLDDPGSPAELRRLEARTILTFGKTVAVPGGRAVPLTEAGVSDAVESVTIAATAPHQVTPDGPIVVTRSVSANAAAVTTARNAGAEVLEVPTADPRRSPAAAAARAARPDAPVIAFGTPFVKGFAYSLDIVRKNVRQPHGGYLAMPGRHYVAMYGHPGMPSLGVLGEQGVKGTVERVKRLVRKYEAVGGKGRFIPTFEIISTVASSSAGKDKNYSQESPIKTLRPLIDAAGKAGVYVILDLQPGRTNFLTQAKRYRSLLELPNVGLALDPEWRLKKKQRHLRQIGSVSVEEINRTGDWLARLTRERSLPQKLFVLHQFATSMIKHRGRLDTAHPELATVLHVDGSGPQGAKQGTWKVLHRDAPAGVFWGWKNFVDEDKPMLDVRQTWRKVKPRPELVTYQ